MPCQIPITWKGFIRNEISFMKYPNKFRTLSVQVRLPTPDMHCMLEHRNHETECVNIISESMPHPSTFSMDFTSRTHCILGNSTLYLKRQD